MRMPPLGVFLLSLCFGVWGCNKTSGQAPKAAHITFYSGYASGVGGKVYGRVSKGPPDAAPKPGESIIKRVEETLLELDARALHHAQVEVQVGGQTMTVQSDARGFLEFALPQNLPPPAVSLQIRLRQPGYEASPVATHLPVFDNEPGLALISDVDDTLLDSQVTDKTKLAANAIVRSTWELETFDEVPQTLSRFAHDKPVFYLSGSPWGFHDRIRSFFERMGFPKGTLVLKRFSAEPLLDQMAFKYPHLKELFAALPKRRFLLFGDSGEKDPEIYARLRLENPTQVADIYIHHITKEPADSPRFSGMKVFNSWAALRP